MLLNLVFILIHTNQSLFRGMHIAMFLLSFELDLVPPRYAGKVEYCPGVVTSTEDGVSVNFDGGWHGASIPLRHVRRLGPSPGSGARLQGARAKPPGLSAGAQLRSTGCILDLDVGSLGGDTFIVGDQVREKRVWLCVCIGV